MLTLPRLVTLTLSVAFAAPFASGQSGPNYKLANKFSDRFIRQYVHSTSVRPNWIGKTDRFWYHYKSSDGHRYWLVDPAKKTKRPLFNHDELAAKLSLALRTPLDAPNVQLSGARIDKEGKVLSFSYKGKRFELTLATGALEEKKGSSSGPASMPPFDLEQLRRRGRSRGFSRFPTSTSSSKPWSHRSFSPDKTAYLFVKGRDLYMVEAPPKVRKEIAKMTAEMEKKKKAEEAAKKAGKSATKKGDEKKMEKVEKKDTGKKMTVTKKGTAKKMTKSKKDTSKKDTSKKDTAKKATAKGKTDDKKKVVDNRDKREKWADKMDEKRARRLSFDSAEFYSFGSSSFRRNLEDKKKFDAKKKERAFASWSKDSSAFYIRRRDTRNVKELFLVNSLSKPRPKLERYKYAMPGEDNISLTELHFYDRTKTRKLVKVKPKWHQESYMDIHYKLETNELRFVRMDRPRRKVELVKLDVTTGKETVLLADSYTVGLIGTQSVRYLKKRKEMIWWSERSGWGHYYLYDLDGKLKNTITWGTFRANRIVEVDEEKGILYFYGSGRERKKSGVKENVYYQHLYRVFLDGTGLQLLDPGDAYHTSVVSPTKQYLVDNCDRVDLEPRSMLRNAAGTVIMELERMDIAALTEVGWRLPETFTVKAADGITDLFGNMWKPFDFNPKKKYPIILHVYPGPQQEGVTHRFSATHRGRQQLANLGFIVVQVGHRGGAPGRSKAYQNFSYWNMRDYALEDKKVAVEKLAAKHSFIDIDRVGIYGHSGGGFFTATAMLKPPYNEFFKVGVSSAGNHDNNIYNNSWSERYHGLKEVKVKVAKKKTTAKKDDKKAGAKKGVKKNNGKVMTKGKSDSKKKDDKAKTDNKKAVATETKTRYEIHIPTTWELAKNLKGRLLLVHGDMDNNVHPAGTVRLVDALIKANKRFDMLFIPGARHGFGAATPYFTQRMWEYFGEHLLGDYQRGADILQKKPVRRR